MKKIWLLLAVLFPIGYIPVAPGTAASLVAAVLVYVIEPYKQAPFYIQLIVIAIIFILGIYPSGVAEKHFNKKDPHSCVIDEVPGQMISLLLVPPKISFYIAGFLLFRFFDVLKPFPIRKLEKIHGGLGIMIDDIMAAIYALIVMQLYIHFFWK